MMAKVEVVYFSNEKEKKGRREGRERRKEGRREGGLNCPNLF
jgi:hypothetical protein